MAFRRRAFPLASMARRLIRSTLRPSNPASSFCMCSCSNKPHRASGANVTRRSISRARDDSMSMDPNSSSFVIFHCRQKRVQLSLVNRQPLQNCHNPKDTVEAEGPDHRLSPSCFLPSSALSSKELARTTEPCSAQTRGVPDCLEGRAGPVRASKELARTTEPGSAQTRGVPDCLEGRAGPVRASKKLAPTTEPDSAEASGVPSCFKGRAGPVRASC